MGNIAFQRELRPVLPNVYGTLDYREFREVLEKIDEVLIKSDLEHEVASHAVFVNKDVAFFIKQLTWFLQPSHYQSP